MSLINWIKEKLFCDLAIDLGTANTLFYLKGKGIIVQEPSMVVVNRQNGKVEVVGKQAKDMLGKTPASVLVVKPMRDGLTADFELAEYLLPYFPDINRTTFEGLLSFLMMKSFKAGTKYTLKKHIFCPENGETPTVRWFELWGSVRRKLN